MLLLYVIVILILSFLIFILWTYCKLSKGICKFSGHLVGKVVIVTGASSGIGFEAANNLAQRGAFVIAACRNLEKGENAVKKIIALSGNKDVYLIQLDLASFASVRKFVDDVLQLVSRVDILINNAGVYTTKNEKTEDGFLVGMQVNYLGPFLLTSLLLPLLKKSAPSRIINVASILYKLGEINFEQLENSTNFNPIAVYRNSKLFLILMSSELDNQLNGTGVTVNSLHPGAVTTEMVENFDIFIIRYILKMIKTFFKTPWEGAQTTIYLSVSPDVANVSGCYFEDCREVPLRSKAKDLVLGKKVWQLSEKLVKLK